RSSRRSGDGVDALALGDRDPRVLAHARGEHLGDALAGLGPAGVHDPAARMPALPGEARVELDAEVDELRDALRRLAREQLDRALATEPAAGGEGVRRVQRGIVVG